MLAKLVGARGRPRVEHDRGGDHLTPFRVRDAEYRGLRDVDMLEQAGLDLAGREVLAAPHDDVVEPPVYVEEAVGVERTRVTGVEPPVVVGRPPPDVLAGDLVPAHPDLTSNAVGH